MKTKNRFFEFFAILFVCISLFGCQKRNSEEQTRHSELDSESIEMLNKETSLLVQHDNAESVKVVATIFPLYDWAKNVALDCENVSVELLIKNGVDLHSFQPSTSDIVKISTCDVLIYVGGESDFWISDALKNATNKDMRAINLMQELSDSVKEEEIVEGMIGEKEDSDGDFESLNHRDEKLNHQNRLRLAKHEHNEVEYDEHLWLSVKNAELAVQKIADVLSEKDKSEAELIKANEDKYLEMLKQVDCQVKPCDVFEENSCNNDMKDKPDNDTESNSENDKDMSFPCLTRESKTIIVCDRFPFRYMTDELGIKYYAAFVGCSAETEASFETIAFLSNKIKELGATEVFVTESSDKKIAKTVIQNAGLTENECKIVTLDSMQSTTLEDAKKGANYIDIMKENYKKLGE